jgi:hypothetical protein
MLLLPLASKFSASTPSAVLKEPLVLLKSAALPLAVLLEPLVLAESAEKPMAVLAAPEIGQPAAIAGECTAQGEGRLVVGDHRRGKLPHPQRAAELVTARRVNVRR